MGWGVRVQTIMQNLSGICQGWNWNQHSRPSVTTESNYTYHLTLVLEVSVFYQNPCTHEDREPAHSFEETPNVCLTRGFSVSFFPIVLWLEHIGSSGGDGAWRAHRSALAWLLRPVGALSPSPVDDVMK